MFLLLGLIMRGKIAYFSGLRQMGRMVVIKFNPKSYIDERIQ
jgi:hypothetical protein